MYMLFYFLKKFGKSGSRNKTPFLTLKLYKPFTWVSVKKSHRSIVLIVSSLFICLIMTFERLIFPFFITPQICYVGERVQKEDEMLN